MDWRIAVSWLAHQWWRVKNPVAAWREIVRLRKAKVAARARFEAFKRSRGR